MLAASFAFSIHIFSVKILGETIPPVFIATIFLFIATLTTGTIYLLGNETLSLQELVNGKTILLLVLAGVTIGLTDFWVAKSYVEGAPLSLGYPVFGTVSTFLLVGAGFIFMKEHLSYEKIIGIFLAVISFYLLSKK